MQLTFQGIVQLVLQKTGKSIKSFSEVTLDMNDLAGINDSKQQTRVYFGTFSGMFGATSQIRYVNAIGVNMATGFVSSDEISAGTSMGVGTMSFPNQIFSYIEAIGAENRQIVFSGYMFDLLDCSQNKNA